MSLKCIFINFLSFREGISTNKISILPIFPRNLAMILQNLPPASYQLHNLSIV